MPSGEIIPLKHLILPDMHHIALNSSICTDTGQRFRVPGPVFTKHTWSPWMKLPGREQPDGPAQLPRAAERWSTLHAHQEGGTGRPLLLTQHDRHAWCQDSPSVTGFTVSPRKEIFKS